MSEFLRMGGYAAFVWPSFALAAVVVAWNVIEPFDLFEVIPTWERRRPDSSRRKTLAV